MRKINRTDWRKAGGAFRLRISLGALLAYSLLGVPALADDLVLGPRDNLFVPSGQVGIGTTDPGLWSLAIDSELGTPLKLSRPGGGVGLVLRSDAQLVNEKSWGIDIVGPLFRIKTVEDNDLTLINAPFVIHRDGNVGISTSSPSEALDVMGTVQATDPVTGVVGVATNVTGTNYGVRGKSDSLFGRGVFGEAPMSKARISAFMD